MAAVIKDPKPSGFKQEIYSLVVPEAKSSRSRYWQDWFLLEAPRRIYSLPLLCPASSAYQQSCNPWLVLSFCRASTVSRDHLLVLIYRLS
jgi:hypothetical protein